MEPNKITWGSPADWGIIVGEILLLIGVVGYVTGLSSAATMLDATTKVSDTTIPTIMIIMSIVGLAFIAIGVLMKRRK